MSDEPELQLNQQLSDNTGRVEKNVFITSLELPCIESKLQQLLGINPKIWNDLKNNGVLPRTGTNKDFLVKIFNHYRSKSDAAVLKEQTRQSKGDGKDGSTFDKLVMAEKLQRIRLDVAKEEEIHIRNSVARGTVLDKNLLYQLVAPFISNIANVLRAAVDTKPELQSEIDKCFHILHQTGKILMEQVDVDNERFVKHMLEREIDLDNLISEEYSEN